MKKALNWVAKSRKAIGAFLVPFLALPLVPWISGDQPYDEDLLRGAVLGAVTGALTYWLTNRSPDGDPVVIGETGDTEDLG